VVILITGGAGFLGRWVVNALLKREREIVIIDNLSNGRKENLSEFQEDSKLKEIIYDDIRNRDIIDNLFLKYKFESCIHLAAQINVQESIDYPDRAFNNNIIGTYNILEAARTYNTKIIIIGTCMVYDLAASNNEAISESHNVKPASPYAGSKLAAEDIALSYYFGLKLPVVILRPFNIYGPFQKTNMEGGVISIFVNLKLKNEKLKIFGDGTQTRDFLYVEDCAEFIVKAEECEQCVGEIINAGSGNDITINDLAKLIVKDENQIVHVKHHHPQAEIMKLLCNNSKAKKLLNWEPITPLEEGIQKLEYWIRESELKN